MPEPDSTLSPELSQWIAVRDEHIEQLETTLADLRERVRQYAGTAAETEKIRQEHLAYVAAYQHRTGELQTEVQHWQDDYERLRIQKGGFGIKTMTAAGITSMLVGGLICRIFLMPKDSHTEVFDQFRLAAGFQVEYAVSQRQFEQAEKIITDHAGTQKYAQIRPELDFLSSVVGASRRAFTEANLPVQSNVSGYAVSAPDKDSLLVIKPQRQLVITESGALVHLEAMPKSGVLVALKKKEKVNQWDRTPGTEKLPVISNGNKGIAEDYWYEVETTDGYKGWLFGYYTNASLRRFKPEKPDSLAIKKDSLPK